MSFVIRAYTREDIGVTLLKPAGANNTPVNGSPGLSISSAPFGPGLQIMLACELSEIPLIVKLPWLSETFNASMSPTPSLSVSAAQAMPIM